jgi:hypothetical protein
MPIHLGDNPIYRPGTVAFPSQVDRLVRTVSSCDNLATKRIRSFGEDCAIACSTSSIVMFRSRVPQLRFGPVAIGKWVTGQIPPESLRIRHFAAKTWLVGEHRRNSFRLGLARDRTPRGGDKHNRTTGP